MSLYALIDTNGNVVNIVNWDGVTVYNVVPDTLVSATGHATAQIGGTYLNSVFIAPAAPTPAQGIVFLNSPATGASVPLPNPPQPQNVLYAIFEPAAALAALSVTLPTNPQDNAEVTIYSIKAVSALTVIASSGQSIAPGAPTALAAMIGQTLTYSAQYSTWFQLG